MKIIISKTKNKQWNFRVVAKNGKTLCHSECYTRSSRAMDAAKLLKAQMAGAQLVEAA